MKAALALVFFACIAGSMASDARGELLGQLVGQGQAIAQVVISQLQQQILGFVQQAIGQITSLVGSIGGRFDFNIAALFDQFKPMLDQLAGQALTQILGGLSGLIGGRAENNIGSILSQFLAQIQGTVTSIGQQLLNQGLGAVLGGLGSLGGSRGFGDILAALQGHISTAVTAAQGALGGALGNLSTLGSSLIDASKPHWEQLQEQLLGHGLNVLGSISETINNVHGSIGGR
jgi:hypothetical protein